MRIDSHQHFWSYDERGYPWIPKGSALQRDWLPQDLEPLLKEHALDGSIAVQARQSIQESRWLLELADRNPAIKGVVGWVDLRSESVEKELRELKRHPRLVGVRHVAQDEPDDQFLMRPEFLRGIGVLKSFDLVYEILIYPRQLPAAIGLVKKFPEQKFVLDHMAKPEIREARMSPWREQVAELSKQPHVTCKISGLVTEASHRTWKPADFIPYLDAIFELFGAGRLIYGSDWPVCLLAASYADVFGLVDRYTKELSKEARTQFFGENAARIYRLRA